MDASPARFATPAEYYSVRYASRGKARRGIGAAVNAATGKKRTHREPAGDVMPGCRMASVAGHSIATTPAGRLTSVPRTQIYRGQNHRFIGVFAQIHGQVATPIAGTAKVSLSRTRPQRACLGKRRGDSGKTRFCRRRMRTPKTRRETRSCTTRGRIG
jgi:hypothetical protein